MKGELLQSHESLRPQENLSFPSRTREARGSFLRARDTRESSVRFSGRKSRLIRARREEPGDLQRAMRADV